MYLRPFFSENGVKFKSHTNSRLKGIIIERINITERR